MVPYVIRSPNYCYLCDSDAIKKKFIFNVPIGMYIMFHVVAGHRARWVVCGEAWPPKL